MELCSTSEDLQFTLLWLLTEYQGVMVMIFFPIPAEGGETDEIFGHQFLLPSLLPAFFPLCFLLLGFLPLSCFLFSLQLGLEMEKGEIQFVSCDLFHEHRSLNFPSVPLVLTST